MDIADVSQALVEKCLVYSNGGSSGNSTSGGASGIGVTLSNNVVVQYCEVYNTETNLNDPTATFDGNGIDFDWGTRELDNAVQLRPRQLRRRAVDLAHRAKRCGGEHQ